MVVLNAPDGAIAGDLAVVTLARWLGHSSPTITLDYYAHFMPEAGGEGAKGKRRPAGPTCLGRCGCTEETILYSP
ncbi:hypothetical protein GCM10010254_48230 [Streptomyces chromofuscus]|nr:hypothetical protein GCM10010254_48230 [Streptomyces chromofuscus]